MGRRRCLGRRNRKAAFDYTTVDCVAAMITELVMEPGIQGRRFHMLHPKSVTMDDFAKAASKVDLDLKPVPYAKFVEAVSDAISADTAYHSIRLHGPIPNLRWDHATLSHRR